MINDLHKKISNILKEVGLFLLESYNSIPPSKARVFSYSQEIRKKAEKKIIDYVKVNNIKHTLITEIHGVIKGDEDVKWHIHALDGAVNFATKTPCFGVSIGVTKKNKVVYGAIYNPFFDEHTYAIKGKGAFLNGQKINVSNQEDLSHSIGSTAPHISKKLSKPLNKLVAIAPSINKFRISSLGAGVFHSTYVASGRRDFWLSADGPLFDVCVPASLIIQEAGGRVTTFEGNNWEVGDLTLLATNGVLHEKILEIIR